jgi:hypothetical protein
MYCSQKIAIAHCTSFDHSDCIVYSVFLITGSSFKLFFNVIHMDMKTKIIWLHCSETGKQG